MNKYQQFRSENPVFLYKSYSIKENHDKIDLEYCFEIPDLAEFHPKWSFPNPKKIKIENNLTFERLVFSLGMVEAVSYWKSVCSPEFRIMCGELNAEQILWWKKLWYNGLGEFFFVNEIETDIESFVTMHSLGKFISSDETAGSPDDGCLVPVGGGKDSALSVETLKNAGMNCKCYTINGRCSVTGTVKAAGFSEDDLITVKRIFDRSLLNLNSKGYLNGHTPFSAIVAFSAEITAYLNGLKYVVLSNESSANESTVVGQSVNHQYSKSLEFESDFHNYEQKYLNTGAYYFSFLRPLAEFQIAKMFVGHKKYLKIFRSCNLGGKVSPDIWCSDCPKCLFVALILSPFVDNNELVEIFGKNLLEEEGMLDYFIELIGQSEHKPFECVGSIDEINLAVSLAIRNYEKNGTELPLLFKEYKNRGLYIPETIDERNDLCCKSYETQNLLPEKFEKILKSEMERLL